MNSSSDDDFIKDIENKRPYQNIQEEERKKMRKERRKEMTLLSRPIQLKKLAQEKAQKEAVELKAKEEVVKAVDEAKSTKSGSSTSSATLTGVKRQTPKLVEAKPLDDTDKNDESTFSVGYTKQLELQVLELYSIKDQLTLLRSKWRRRSWK